MSGADDPPSILSRPVYLERPLLFRMQGIKNAPATGAGEEKLIEQGDIMHADKVQKGEFVVSEKKRKLP